MRVLQINSVVNSGSTGRIAEDIGRVLINNDHESYIAYGRESRLSQSKIISIGNKTDVYKHFIISLLLDRHGLGSSAATKRFINIIDNINPDIIHLHNIHGYYLNYKYLFEYLKKNNKPLVWTFHDCWPFTGHCTYFEYEECYKWKNECKDCPKIKYYPKSILIDNSKNNYNIKSKLFTSIKRLQIVTPSHWLKEHVKSSFLKQYDIATIHNGIDLSVFDYKELVEKRFKNDIGSKPYILGVANIWSSRKGLTDFIKICDIIPDDIKIVLVGIPKDRSIKYPKNVIVLERTESISDLAHLYANALCFVNPTYQDNFPTTNIEALACGTPVITYDTGGSPEAIDKYTGRVVPKGDIQGLVDAIVNLMSHDRTKLRIACRKRAEEKFDKDKQFLKYLELYLNLTNV